MDLHLSLETRGFESGVLVWECYQLKQENESTEEKAAIYPWLSSYYEQEIILRLKKKRYMTNSLTFKVLQSKEIGNNLKS